MTDTIEAPAIVRDELVNLIGGVLGTDREFIFERGGISMRFPTIDASSVTDLVKRLSEEIADAPPRRTEADIRADERERLARAAVPIDAWVSSPDWSHGGMALEDWLRSQGGEDE